MAILAKATAEVRIERFFVLNSERRPSRGEERDVRLRVDFYAKNLLFSTPKVVPRGAVFIISKHFLLVLLSLSRL
jgi:hypothetical protein